MSECAFFSLLLNAVHSLMHVSNCGFYELCERRGYLRRYKMERKPHLQPSDDLVRGLQLHNVFAQLLGGPILTYFLLAPAFAWCGMHSMDAPLPSTPTMALTFVTAHLSNDLGFYATHRLGHTRLFYRFHKKHHEFKGPIAAAAEHAGPLESLLSNLLPTMAGVMFLPTHPLCVVAWFALRLHQAYENHSGYCFEGSLADRLWLTHGNAAAHHDFHHTANTGNFGVGMWTDWLFGTMDQYQRLGGFEGYLGRVKAKATAADAKTDAARPLPSGTFWGNLAPSWDMAATSASLGISELRGMGVDERSLHSSLLN